MTRYTIQDGQILLYAPYAERHRAASLPGARWNPVRQCWSLPATPATWEAVVTAFPSLASEHNKLASTLRVRQEVRSRPVPPTGGTPDYPYQTFPWRHQVEATRFARDMDVALLHMHMGTGKTKVTLDACRARGHHRVLIICPKSVIQVWQDEICKHAAEEWDILLLGDGSINDRAGRLEWIVEDPPRPLVAVVNYEATWREPLAGVILGTDWDCVVFDESQKIKSPGSKQSRFAARIRAKHKLALTGTPMPHSPLDLYAQYRALDPGIFGTRFTRFRDRYAVMGGYEGRQIIAWRNQDELRRKMDLICHHVPSEALDLPPVQFLERECVLESKAGRVYRQLEEDFIAEVESGVVTAANAVVKLLRLQQVAAGFVKTEEGEVTDVSKAKRELLAEMLEEIGPEPVVVFCRFLHDLKVVAEEADRAGRPYCEISGSIHEYQRWKEETDRFAKPAVLGVQVQAGGLGIDLSEARYAIFYTLTFSLGDYQQAVARVHRPGQDHPVMVYRLVTAGTVDRKILRALDRRRDVIESVLKDYAPDRALRTGGEGRKCCLTTQSG